MNNPAYTVIDGITGTGRQLYAINGMLEIKRSVSIRNLDLVQLDNDSVVRTIYAVGTSAPINLSLRNMKIMRGPEQSGGTGSVADSAGIWIENAQPYLDNIEIYGGGKGRGIQIANSSNGSLTHVYVHDIIWEPYDVDRNNPDFWGDFTLSHIQSTGDWNGITIHDYRGGALTPVRIEEQVYGINLDAVSNFTLRNVTIRNLGTRFSDGQVYPYQTDGITVVSGSNVDISRSEISHVAEGFDIPGFPPSDIWIDSVQVSDAPLYCFKVRGSYDSRPFTMADATPYPVISRATGSRCGIAAYVAAAGATVWLDGTKAIDTGLGPNGGAPPQIYQGAYIAGVAAYRFTSSVALPALADDSRSLGMRIVSATVSNPNSTYMQTAFHSELSPTATTAHGVLSSYKVSNPSNPGVEVAQQFDVLPNNKKMVSTRTMSWNDLGSMISATLGCTVKPEMRRLWFTNVFERVWNYGQTQAYLKSLAASGDRSACI